MSVTSESTLPLEHQEKLLLQKISSLSLCAGNEVKIAERYRDLADLRERMAAVKAEAAP